MLFNEMQYKVHYEMKKEEMEKVLLASNYFKDSQKASLYPRLFHAFKKRNLQKKELKTIPNCCDIKIQKVCCEN